MTTSAYTVPVSNFHHELGRYHLTLSGFVFRVAEWRVRRWAPSLGRA